MSDKKSPGRPRKYFNSNSKDGAPMLCVRLDTEVFEWIRNVPGGTRKWIQDRVNESMIQAKPKTMEESYFAAEIRDDE